MKINLRITKSLSPILILAAILLLLSGCDTTFSIFQTISQEKKQTGADLFLNTTVRAMGEDGTNYYALLSKVFYRSSGSATATWNLLSVGGTSDYFASGLASNGGTLYVAKSDPNNVLDDIYSTTNQGTTWTAMGAKADLGSGESVDWLVCANAVLFVAAHDSSMNYTLYYYDTVSTSFQSTGVTSSGDNLLRNVLYDGTGGKYWALTASDAYVGASPTTMAKDSTPTLSLGLLGIATDGAGRVIVTRSDGKAYSYNGVWSIVTIKDSTALGPAFLLSKGGTRILVGKGVSSYGYMEYDATASKLYENGSNYISTASSIYYGAMLNKKLIGFWQPSADPNVLFALLASGGTDSYALYRNDYDVATSKWSGWTAE